jgi:hypothetical protein
MGFPGWKSRVALVIQSSQVPADVTDFPVLLNKENTPQESYEADSGWSALNGGGDLRFSSDSAGNTRLACEVETFVTDNNPANANVSVFVKIPSISSASNTTFYMFYGKAGQSQPARNDTYGLENVWNSGYKGVWHLNQTFADGSVNFTDSTSLNNTGEGKVLDGSPTVSLVDGKWGGKAQRCSNAVAYDTVWAIEIDAGSDLNFSASPMTVTAWLKFIDTTQGWWLGKGDDAGENWQMRGLGINEDGSNRWMWWNRTGGDEDLKSTSSPSNDTWFHWGTSVASDGTLRFYLNGAAAGTESAGSVSSGAGNKVLSIGTGRGDTSARAEPWKGNVDEVRIHNVARSANYILTEYRTTNTPSTFIIEGTPARLKRSQGFMAAFFGM